MMNSIPSQHSCAFCTPFLPHSRLSIATPLQPFPSQGSSFRALPLRRSTLYQNRRRRLTAMYNNQNRNGNNNNIPSQIADLIVSAGRFFRSPSGQVVLWIGLAWLVITGRIGILFDSFLFIFAFLTIVPVLAVVVFRWWLNRQLIQGACPNCGAQVTGLRNRPFPCTSCGTTVVLGKRGNVSVKDPSTATIDIDAKSIDDS